MGISLNELRTLQLYCKPNQTVKGVCPITNGMQTVTSLGLDNFTIGECAGILVFYIVFCRAVAFLGIRYIKW